MIRSRLFDKPSHVHRAQQLPLAVAGELPDYTPGDAYEGRLDILGSVGRCRVELLEGDLPPGTEVFVDNFTRQVVVKWPPYSPARPTEEGIVNNDFSLGTLAGWRDMRGNSWQVGLYDSTTPGYKDNPPPGPAPGNLAAWLRGHGRGNHDLLSDLYPTVPGLPMSASSLWYQGPSNKDNNNLFTGIQFYTPGRVPLGEPVLGDRIHDRTNKARHRSTVTTQAPAGAGFASVLLRAYRRNSRNRELNVDDVVTSGFSYVSSVGWEGETDFPLALRVTDSTGRTAVWEGVIRAFLYHSGWWWRILIEETVDPATYCALGEVEMRGLPGGPDLCGNGRDTEHTTTEGFAFSPDRFDFNHEAYAAVDNNTTNVLSAWVQDRNTAHVRPQYWAFRFRDSTVVRELALWAQARSDLLGRSPKRFRVQTCSSSDTRYPATTLASRVAAFDWFDVATFDNATGWAVNTPKIFTVQE